MWLYSGFTGSLYWRLARPEVSMLTLARPQIQHGRYMQLANRTPLKPAVNRAIDTTHVQMMSRLPVQSPLSSVLQDAYEFPEVGYIPELYATTLVPAQSEGNPAVCYRPCSCHWCYSSCFQCLPHPPIIMYLASLSATPSLAPKCISPAHALLPVSFEQ